MTGRVLLVFVLVAAMSCVPERETVSRYVPPMSTHEIRVMSGVGSPSTCIVRQIVSQAKTRDPKARSPVISGMTITLPAGPYRAELTCSFSNGRDVELRHEFVALAGRSFGQLAMASCLRDEFTDDYRQSLVGRIAGSLPVQGELTVLWMNETSREVREARISKTGEFEVSLSCEGWYLAMLTHDSKTIGFWRVTIGPSQKTIDLAASELRGFQK